MLSNHRCSPEWSTTVLLALAKLLKLILDSKLLGRNFQFSGKKSEGRALMSANLVIFVVWKRPTRKQPSAQSYVSD